MSRMDAHRPSAIQPEDYEFIAFSYLRVDDIGSAQFLMEERRRLSEHMDRTGAKYSGHEHGGTCHICGSVNAIYTAVFFHSKSNSYVKTGLDCAAKLECEGIEAFRRNVSSALEAKAGKRKAQAVLEKAGHGAAWAIYVATGDKGRDESTVTDIVGKLVHYGNISEKQMAFIGRLLTNIENRPAIEAQRAAETEAAAPVPVSGKRMTVRGTVVAVRIQDCDGFFSRKMLVQHADGWKVWGSIPSSLNSDDLKGATIQFDAAVQASDKDTKFGFFSRPTKAQRVEG